MLSVVLENVMVPILPVMFTASQQGETQYKLKNVVSIKLGANSIKLRAIYTSDLAWHFRRTMRFQ
jgi:hypothetical protein